MSNSTSSNTTHPGFMNAPNRQLPLQNNGVGMQTQPHLGVGNHQNLMPFMPNMQPSMNTPAFVNNAATANHLLPLQNNQMLMPHMGLPGPQQGQSHVGLGPQNSVGNANCNPMFPVQEQIMQNAAQINFSQIQGHILAQTIMNMLQQPNMNMNMNIPNGQFCAPYPLQNVNQQLPMQVSNTSQVVPSGMHMVSRPMFGFPNQVPQAMVTQNPIFSANPQLGLVPGNHVRPQVDQTEKTMLPPNVNTNAFGSPPFASQHLQGNTSASLNPNLIQLHNTKNSQPSAFTKSQANPNSNIKTNGPNYNWKGSPSKNFKNKPNRGVFQGGFQKKSKFRDINNEKRNGFPKEHKGKGRHNEKAGHFGVNSKEHKQEPKRSFSVIYTEQEIQQWREARRKNHPFRDNIQKNEYLKDSKATAREVLQRELKEILAKQAELGVEVAEIPSYYLKDSENQGLQSEGKNTFTKQRKFQNKFNKRSDRKGRFAKKQKFTNKDFSESPSLNRRNPTLLQKLLTADIKRDKSHLLQAFRFMVMNSFFKEFPNKPLVYPSVVVKETGSEGDVEEKHLNTGKDVLECGNEITVQKIVYHNEDNGHDGEDEDSDDDEKNSRVHINPHKEPSSFVKRQCHDGEGIDKSDEEEGEIID